VTVRYEDGEALQAAITEKSAKYGVICESWHYGTRTQ
jgi:hypothetical protein